MANNYSAQRQPIQRKINNTGLPDKLKAGIENLSGYSMDDVKVHYNCDKPAQLQAHAYAQGTNIHLASGQENHLPHEAWHEVQQKQGRVKPTMQMKGNVNDDAGLEKEADVMGIKSLQFTANIEPKRKNGLIFESSLSNNQPIKSNILQAQHNYSSIRYKLPQMSFDGPGLGYNLKAIDLANQDLLTIQRHTNRLVTDPFFKDSKKTSHYFAGWIIEVINSLTAGNLYDGFAILLSLTGDASLLAKIEEVARFMQHHPEVLDLLGLSFAPFLVSQFGISLWAANVIGTVLSRGASADYIGDVAFSILMSSSYSGVAGMVVNGIKRQLGRSIINRGLVFAYHFGGSLVSGASRILHGYSLTGGSLKKKALI